MIRTLLPLIPLLLFTGCSWDEAKRHGYQMLHDRQCIEEVGKPVCDPERPDYDEYKDQGEKATNKSGY